MGGTLGQRIVDRLGWLDTLAEKVQPKVQEAVGEGEERGGTMGPQRSGRHLARDATASGPLGRARRILDRYPRA
jgi:hypothetical protein